MMRSKPCLFSQGGSESIAEMADMFVKCDGALALVCWLSPPRKMSHVVRSRPMPGAGRSRRCFRCRGRLPVDQVVERPPRRRRKRARASSPAATREAWASHQHTWASHLGITRPYQALLLHRGAASPSLLAALALAPGPRRPLAPPAPVRPLGGASHPRALSSEMYGCTP